ncbi:MAG: multiple sugar transport system permease protein [Gaiellaceae bacterium]|nr:multiple sugar transport system permease protein [Gaiellaceae bacterium]
MAVTAKRQTLGSARIREALVGYAFIAVPMGLFLTFFIYPLVYSLYISRYDWGVFGKIETLGWDNYRKLAHDEIFWRAIKNTLLYTVVIVPVEMALALTLAVIVNAGIRGKAFFRSAFYFPSLASSAAITAIAIYILSADGLLNAVIGGNRAWFADSDTALWSIAGLNAWTTSGTLMLFYLAALQAIPTDVYEAAAIDGAKTWRTFWKITFPLLKPGHFFVSVVSVIGALQVFDQAFLVSGGSGGPNYSTLTVVLYLYRTAIRDVQFGYAAAVGIALFVLIFTLTLIQRLLFGRAETA